MVNFDVFKDATIDEDEHERELQDAARAEKENLILKGVVSLEKLYDLQNHFRGLVNPKNNNSMLSHEKINLGIEKNLKFDNLGTCCRLQEWQFFICVFKRY